MIELLRTLKARTSRHNSSIFAAGIAFFAFLALIPALTAVIGVYGLVADPDDVARQLTDLLAGAPPSTREFLVEQMSDIAATSGGVLGLGVAISLALSVFSASSAVANLVKSLNVAFEIGETRSLWRLRGLAISLMVGGIALLGVVMFLLAALPAVRAEWGLGGPSRLALDVGRYLVLGLAMAWSLSVLYRVGPDHRVGDPTRSRHPFSTGALVATGSFVVVSSLFSFSTTHLAAFGETYGPLATIIVLLLWFQLSALTVIVGAEVDAERTNREDLPRGSKRPGRSADG